MGRKRSVFGVTLHEHLSEDFERLCKTGLKFNANLLRHLAIRLMNELWNQFYHKQMRDVKSETLVLDIGTSSRIHMQKIEHDIIRR